MYIWKMKNLLLSYIVYKFLYLQAAGLNACSGVSGTSNSVTLPSAQLDVGQQYTATLTVSAAGRKAHSTSQLVSEQIFSNL